MYKLSKGVNVMKTLPKIQVEYVKPESNDIVAFKALGPFTYQRLLPKAKKNSFSK